MPAVHSRHGHVSGVLTEPEATDVFPYRALVLATADPLSPRWSTVTLAPALGKRRVTTSRDRLTYGGPLNHCG
jgi:hypothetical protein